MKKAMFAVSTIALGFLVAACDTEDTDDSSPGTANQALTAQIRVVHLSPDAPAVDVYVNGADRAVSDLSFASGTGFLTVPAGTYDFSVAPAGQSAMASVLDIEGLTLESGKAYTAVAFDELASIQALALEEDTAGLPEGYIRVRAIHAATGVGTVDIWNITDPMSPSPLYTGVGFGAVGDHLDLPAGAYSLGFDVDADAMPDVTFDLPALPAGEVANLFAVNDGAVFIAAQLSDGSVARIDAN